MGKAYIAEFSDLPRDASGNWIPCPDLDKKVASQVVTFSTETDSSAFDDRTKYISVTVDADCQYEYGDAPTALTASDDVILAGVARFFGVSKGKKISFIDKA